VIVKTATECLITLEGVSKAYQQPNGQQISILEPINLELRSGEIVALLGPSGSGKSTLMRIIAGLIPPTDGQVLYHNRPLVGLNPGIAIVFQNFALYPWLTVLENVELGLKAKGELPEPRRQKALRMIDIIGLDGFENAYPKELSGGMRQRVGFARALAVEPELLCMDEPFSALDVLTAENLRFELLDLWLEKKIPTKAVLIVTHGIEEAVI
jgi:NitT/TauT family transport system ATP-binding protein